MPDSQLHPPPHRQSVEVTYLPVSRRPLRHRLAWATRAWARNTFSRDSFITSLKSLLWVVPLTLLIWIYAERAQVASMNMTVTLDSHVNEPGRIVRIVSPVGGTVHVDLRGSQAQLDQVSSWLESTSIPIEVDRNLMPGEAHQISIAAELNRLPRVQNAGVTVSNCIPPDVRVVIDPIIQKDLEIRVRPEDAKLLSGPEVFAPAHVRITGPKSVIDHASRQATSQGQTLVAYANLGPFKQQLAEPGKHVLGSVAVTPSIAIEDPGVSLSPATVSATLEVTDKVERPFTLPYVRVLAAYPPDALKSDQYKAVYDSTIPNVTVSGPEQQIALLAEQKYIPAAIFEVNYSDIDHPDPAQLMFQLPPGVHVSDQDAQRKIAYSFKPRNVEPQ